MSISSESAEQLMRTVIEGEEVCLKITGKAAKELVVLLAAILKSKTQTKGKTRLNNMLRSGKELKVFSIKKEDLPKFTQEAKRYGVLYSALVDRFNKNHDGMVDIMVRAEDASKINRIVERFRISTVNEAEIRNAIARTKAEKDKVPEEKQKGVEEKDIEVKELEKNELNLIQKEENKVPLVEKQTKENQLGNLSGILKKQEGNTKTQKKSVRQDLKEIREELAKKEKTSSKQKDLSKSKVVNHKNIDKSR